MGESNGMNKNRLTEIRELLRPDLIDAADDQELRKAAIDLLFDHDLSAKKDSGARELARRLTSRLRAGPQAGVALIVEQELEQFLADGR